MTTRWIRVWMMVTVCGLFAVSVFASVVAQQQSSDPAAAGPTASNQFAILVTTIAGFASMLAAQLFQFYRENRNRKWDLADRTSAREETRKYSEAQRIESIQAAIELSRASIINREHIIGAVDKNTALTSLAADKASAAYTAANNFNEKLEALHRELATFALPRKDDPKES